MPLDVDEYRPHFQGPASFDPQNYVHHLGGMDLSEAEKIEFIRTLWLIAQCFVDDAFSGRAESASPNGSSLKSGFEEATVVDLPASRKTGATAADDNKKEPKGRRKKA